METFVYFNSHQLFGTSPPSEGAPCKVLPSDPQGPGATLLHCQHVSNWPGAKEDLTEHSSLEIIVLRLRREGTALVLKYGRSFRRQWVRWLLCWWWTMATPRRTAQSFLLLSPGDKITLVRLQLLSPWTLAWKTAPSSNEPGFRVFGFATLGVAYPSARGPPRREAPLHTHSGCCGAHHRMGLGDREVRGWMQALLTVCLLLHCISVTAVWARKYPCHSFEGANENLWHRALKRIQCVNHENYASKHSKPVSSSYCCYSYLLTEKM